MVRFLIYLFDCRGRVGRLDWWVLRLAAIFGVASVGVLLSIFLGENTIYMAGCVCLWLQISFTVRRLHDRNMSGWWILLYWVPFFILIVCGCLRGTHGKNRYG
ncbi:DUF805 domain-containing protein [Candidatus Poribacteria bacterium]|nr:DUF805 domain-containing protein [Candidatus Poribacteria bacterium]MYF56761.1 DUF805 domain-containing protein [Candidatus Poribacteria bacterium]